MTDAAPPASPPPASPPAAASYRALLAVPGIPGLMGSMTLARIGQAMTGMVLTLLALSVYDSAPLAGLVAFASVVPGLVVSPITGALLDRHGRVRLVALDFLVAAASLGLIAGLSASRMLPPALLVAIAAVASLTNPLSNTGLRSLFPLVVPRPLWERANAGDSVAWVLSSLIGAPLAGLAVQVVGAPGALGVVAGVFLAAVLTLRGVPDPATDVATTGRLVGDAVAGVRYFWSNLSLRGLGASISLVNVTGGVIAIVIPVLALGRLGGGPALVGWLFAAEGVGGMVASLAFGRLRSAGRERRWLALSMLGMAAVLGLLIPDAGVMGVVGVFAAMILLGLLNGPLDIAMFTLRQRRTAPEWMGRAFAVSVSVNWIGSPIGSAMAGALAPSGVVWPVVIAMVCAVAGAAASWWLIPHTDAVGA
jgi:MFS family permease